MSVSIDRDHSGIVALIYQLFGQKDGLCAVWAFFVLLILTSYPILTVQAQVTVDSLLPKREVRDSLYRTPKDVARQDSIIRSTLMSDSVALASQVTKGNSDKAVDVLAKEVKLPRTKSSKAALLWSIIPGGGQAYNGSYWKLPIVAGIYTACTYAITWNNAALVEYQNAYFDLISENPMENTSWQDFIPAGADPQSYVTNASFQDQLKRGRDFYRRYRDLSIIVTVGAYLLVMLDAYVDAELSNFDVSPNLALHTAPTVLSSTPIVPTSRAVSQSPPFASLQSVALPSQISTEYSTPQTAAIGWSVSLTF